MTAPSHPLAAPDRELPAPPPAVGDLVADLPRLPAQRPALLRVVQIADDPASSVRQLADVSAGDPAFAARVLQLANSAYYGRAGRVTSIVPAVNLLGAETLRGLAVTMSLGLSGEHGALPAGFWERASTAAAASRLLAPLVAADPGDAFCVGLLHEVGQALMFRAAPQAYPVLLTSCTESDLAAAERAWCGVSSGQLAAVALRAAGVPEPLGQAIADQQSDPGGRPGTGAEPLPRALRAGILLSRAVLTGEVDEVVHGALTAAVGGWFEVEVLRELALRTAAQAAALSASLR